MSGSLALEWYKYGRAKESATPLELMEPEYLLKPGLVKVDRNSGHGQILFTGSSLFALRTVQATAMTGAAVGGLIGALIGALIDSRRKKPEPTHLDHPEIALLGAKALQELTNTELLCVIPIDRNLIVETTTLGFRFRSAGYPEVRYKGYFRKQAILTYLQMRGIPVDV